MGKRLICTCLLTMLLMTVSGCWDRRELESLGLVQALGLDLDQEQNLTVTTMIAIPSKLGATGEGGGGKDAGVLLVSMKAPSIYEAFNLINTTVNREVTLLQNQILLIGEDMAKFGVRRWIDNLIRFREMRRTLLIFVCKGKAGDILKIQPKLDPNPAEYFRDLVMLYRSNGMYPLTNLHEFMRRYEAYTQQNYAPLLSKYKRQGEAETPPSGGAGEGGEEKPKPEEPPQVRIIGTAVFNSDRVVGQLDLYETQILQIITNQYQEAFLTIKDPLKKETSIIFRLTNAKPTQVKYSQKDVANFTVDVQMEANLVSIQSKIDYTTPEKENFLRKKIAAALKRRIEKVIRKTQTDFQSDVFGFGEKVRNTMLTSTEWDNYHWYEKYPRSKFKVDVNVFIRRVGVQFQPPQERE